MSPIETALRVRVDDEREVAAVLIRPEGARALVIFAHGAGAGMRHVFMEQMSARLAEVGIATFRYQFPYMETGRRGPDRPPVLTATVRAAVAKAAELAPDLLLLAGGKSMGGRMTSLAAAEAPLPDVRALIFFGFPLHPAGRPSTGRAGHLERTGLPMLFLQGERDKLCELTLLRPIVAVSARAPPCTSSRRDHSFRVLKSSGLSTADVFDRLASAVAAWLDGSEGLRAD